MSAVAPAISSIYSVPSDWIGFQPAMILFKKITDENLEKINNFQEIELLKAVNTYNKAALIISEYLYNCPDLLEQYPEISESFREIRMGIEEAEKRYNIKINQRKKNQEEQTNQKLYEEDQKRQEAATYEQYLQQERRNRGLRYGVPPMDKYSCPVEFPIRATANLAEPDSRGIYYYPDERDVEVYWCFSSREEAEADNFRRPYKTPPKRHAT